MRHDRTLLACEYFANIGVFTDAGENELSRTRLRQPALRPLGRPYSAHHCSAFCCRTVVNSYVVSISCEIAGHGEAHDTEADESNAHSDSESQASGVACDLFVSFVGRDLASEQ